MSQKSSWYIRGNIFKEMLLLGKARINLVA